MISKNNQEPILCQVIDDCLVPYTVKVLDFNYQTKHPRAFVEILSPQELKGSIVVFNISQLKMLPTKEETNQATESKKEPKSDKESNSIAKALDYWQTVGVKKPLQEREITVPKVEYWDLKNKVAYFERENCKLEKGNQSLIQSHNREQDIKEKQRLEIEDLRKQITNLQNVWGSALAEGNALKNTEITLRKEIEDLKNALFVAKNETVAANNKFLQTFKDLAETKDKLFQANLEIKARISSEGYKEQKVINLQIKLGNLEAEKKVQSDKHAQVLMDLDTARYELHQADNRQHILRKELEVALSRMNSYQLLCKEKDTKLKALEEENKKLKEPQDFNS